MIVRMKVCVSCCGDGVIAYSQMDAYTANQKCSIFNPQSNKLDLYVDVYSACLPASFCGRRS